jgi:hypothetical protein
LTLLLFKNNQQSTRSVQRTDQVVWTMRCCAHLTAASVVSMRRTPPGPSETNIKYQKAARARIMPGTFILGATSHRKICPVQSTCTYVVVPSGVLESNNAPIYSSFLHHLGHRNTHHHTKPWRIGLKANQTLALRGSHRGELLFG